MEIGYGIEGTLFSPERKITDNRSSESIKNHGSLQHLETLLRAFPGPRCRCGHPWTLWTLCNLSGRPIEALTYCN